MVDATSFEEEEILPLNLDELNDYERYIGVGLLFFDPGGGTLYAELNGILYEWCRKTIMVSNGGSGSSY